MKLQDLINMMNVRDFLVRQMDHPSSAIKKDQVRPVQAIITRLNIAIITESIALDVESIGKENVPQPVVDVAKTTVIRSVSDDDFERASQLVLNQTLPNVTINGAATNGIVTKNNKPTEADIEAFKVNFESAKNDKEFKVVAKNKGSVKTSGVAIKDGVVVTKGSDPMKPGIEPDIEAKFSVTEEGITIKSTQPIVVKAKKGSFKRSNPDE